jgi:transcriptional regulator with XRE-family HTH domain
MVLNNIEIETKVKCLEAGITQEQLGVKVGTTGQYVNRIIKKKDGLVNKTFVDMMEALGYDIQFTYVPKKEG